MYNFLFFLLCYLVTQELGSTIIGVESVQQQLQSLAIIMHSMFSLDFFLLRSHEIA